MITNPCYSYYSWTTATLGSGINITTNDTDAKYSICPKGWRLPTSKSTIADNSDFYQLATSYGMNTGSISQSTTNFYNQAGPRTIPNFVFAGFYYNGSFYNGGSIGYYWSATSSSSTNARYLYFDLGYIGSADNYYRRRGYPVRCLAQ